MQVLGFDETILLGPARRASKTRDTGNPMQMLGFDETRLLGPVRMAGKTREDDEYERARQEYLAAGRRTTADAEAARQRRTGAGTVFDESFARYAAGHSPIATKLESEGWSPTQVQAWMASAASAGPAARALASWRPSVGDAGALRGFDPKAATAFRSRELEGFSADDVSGFDPSQFGQRYAEGAYGMFKRRLDDELERLTQESVGAGRLRSGFFDADRGTVVTRNAADFNDRLAQAAIAFSGQRLDALRSGADLRFRRASSIDENARQMQALQAELAFRRAAGLDENALRAGEANSRLGLEAAIAAEKGEAGDRALQADLASQMDDRMLRAMLARDELRSGENRFNAELGERRGSTALGRALERYRLELEDAARSADREAAWATSQRQFARDDQLFEDARREREYARTLAERERARRAWLEDLQMNYYTIINPLTGEVSRQRISDRPVYKRMI